MPCFVQISSFGTAKIIEIGSDLTELQSNVFYESRQNVGFNFSREGAGAHINRVM